MANLTFVDKNNQKKTKSVFASGVISTSATMDDVLFTLPKASIVTYVLAVVLSASGTATGTIDVKVGDVVVANGLVVGETVITGAADAFYFPTGGQVTVVAGADAPDENGRIKIVMEYIETELGCGQFTD
jgi:hypothetical protein